MPCTWWLTAMSEVVVVVVFVVVVGCLKSSFVYFFDEVEHIQIEIREGKSMNTVTFAFGRIFLSQQPPNLSPAPPTLVPPS
jgi:hypothetical protein